MAFTKKNEEAVSPVIGVILMVAITVILAAVIAAFVFGMAGNIGKGKVVAVTLQRTSSVIVTGMNNGGTDAGLLTNISYSGDRSVISTASCLAAECSPSVAIGCRTQITVSANPVQILAVGTFSDGTTQILLDQKV